MVVKLNTGKVQAMVPELSSGEAVGY